MVRTRWMSLGTLCNKKASKSIENQCLILVAFFGLLKTGNTEMRADSNLVNEENNIDERQIKLFAALWRSLIWMETNKYFNLFSLTFQRCVSLLLFIACFSRGNRLSWRSCSVMSMSSINTTLTAFILKLWNARILWERSFKGENWFSLLRICSTCENWLFFSSKRISNSQFFWTSNSYPHFKCIEM